MDTLAPSWITDGTIDFEYKKYVLLAYLQHVEKQFGSSKLYPCLAELVTHYNNLVHIKSSSETLSESVVRDLKGIDLKKLQVIYDEMDQTDELKTIFELIEFAMPELHAHIESGRDIYEFIESCLNLETIGLMPIYKNEGYVFLAAEDERDVDLYRFKMSMIETAAEKFSAINMEYVGRERRSVSKTFETIKLSLTRKFEELPNPATFLITSRLKFPLVESFVPVAKRMLIRELRLSA